MTKLSRKNLGFAAVFILLLGLIPLFAALGAPAIENDGGTAARSATVTINGQPVNFPDQLPFRSNGDVFVPVGGIFHHLGFSASWNSETQVATVTNPEMTIVIPSSGRYFTVNGQTNVSTLSQRNVGGRLMMPITTIAGVFGATAEWNEVTHSARITMPIDEPPDDDPQDNLPPGDEYGLLGWGEDIRFTNETHHPICTQNDIPSTPVHYRHIYMGGGVVFFADAPTTLTVARDVFLGDFVTDLTHFRIEEYILPSNVTLMEFIKPSYDAWENDDWQDILDALVRRNIPFANAQIEVRERVFEDDTFDEYFILAGATATLTSGIYAIRTSTYSSEPTSFLVVGDVDTSVLDAFQQGAQSTPTPTPATTEAPTATPTPAATQAPTTTPTPSPTPAAVQTPTPAPTTGTPQYWRDAVSTTRSDITLPDRPLTDAERANWITEYESLGGPNAFELEVVRLINEIRADNGLVELEINMILMMAARFYTQTKVDLNLPLGHHEGPYGGSAGTVAAFGSGWNTANGGSGGGGRTPQGQVDGWMNSEGHRRNILNPASRTIGVGSNNGPGGTGGFNYMLTNR